LPDLAIDDRRLLVLIECLIAQVLTEIHCPNVIWGNAF